MDGYQSSGISSVKRIFSFFSGSSARNRGSRWFLRCETRLIFIESISLLTIVENEHNSTFELWVTRIKEIGPSAPIIRSFNHSSRNWIRSLIFTKRLEKKREKKKKKKNFRFYDIHIRFNRSTDCSCYEQKSSQRFHHPRNHFALHFT